jgi:ABC-type multidrug transport system fused ATPase/permease subunit
MRSPGGVVVGGAPGTIVGRSSRCFAQGSQRQCVVSKRQLSISKITGGIHGAALYSHFTGVNPSARLPCMVRTTRPPLGAQAMSSSAAAEESGDPSKESITAMAWSLLVPDALLLGLTLVVLVSSVAVTLQFPLALGDLFDIIRKHTSETTLQTLPTWGTGIRTYVWMVKEAARTAPAEFYRVLGALCGCLVFSSIGNASSSYLSSILGERFGKRLRKKMMKTMMDKNQQFYDGMGQGELMSRLNTDCTVVQTTLVDFLGQRGVRSVVEILMSLVIITIKNPLSAFVSIVVTPCLTLAMRGIVKRSAELTVARQQAAAASMKFASERISNVKTVQLFGKEDAESSGYSQFCDQEYDIARQCATFQGLVEGAGRFAVNMGALSLLAIGGVLVLRGQMEVGTLLAFQVYNFFLSIGLSSLSASLGDFGKVSGALQRLAGVLNDPNNEYEVRDDFEQMYVEDGRVSVEIKFENVWFKYPTSDGWVLKGVSFVASPGSMLALVGPSGSGKSTIAALILGLYRPSKGSVYIGGEEMTEKNVAQLRRQIGTMFQQSGLMSGTIADQVRLGKLDATDDEISSALERAHCKEFMKTDATFDVGERGSNLSGGQQQRVALARALVRNPKLLVLDEPTAALDVDSEQYIDMTLSELQCTKVIIAHRLSTIRKADQILVLEAGEIVERGNHNQLFSQQGKYRTMVDMS